MRKDNSGFTLVEIIVVTVILVVLATLLIPTMVGFITKSSDEKNYENARDLLRSAQAQFYLLYAENSHNSKTPATSAVIGDEDNGHNTYSSCDRKINLTSLAKNIFKEAGLSISYDFPTSVALVVGSYPRYADPTKIDYNPELAYKVYAVIYQPYFKKAYFVMDQEGNVNYPTTVQQLKDIIGNFYENGEKAELQLYYIKLGMGNTTSETVENIWGNGGFSSSDALNANKKKKSTVYR